LVVPIRIDWASGATVTIIHGTELRRCSIRGEFDLGKAGHVAPHFAGWELRAVNDGPRRPMIIGDLPFGGGDVCRTLFIGAVNRSKTVIARLKNAVENFGAGHDVLRLSQVLVRSDIAFSDCGCQVMPTHRRVTAPESGSWTSKTARSPACGYGRKKYVHRNCRASRNHRISRPSS
jgi:hypothetical protein